MKRTFEIWFVRWVLLFLSLVGLVRPLFPADLVLSWTDNANNETGFAIERTTGNGIASPSWSVVASLPANAVSWTDKDLPPGQTYAYRLRAFNASGFSGYAGPVSATIPPVPATPSNAAVVQVNVVITITPGSNASPIVPAPNP